jgi:putative hydrolase of the HAD superfamily
VRTAFSDGRLNDVERADRIADDYRAKRTAAIAPYPGALDVLDTMRSSGVRMALLTNGEAKNQRRSVEQHDLARYFDCIVIEGEFGVGKPDERVFRHALAATGSARARTWMVGDSLEADIAPAVALGLHTVWVNEDGVEAPEHVRPHRVVRSIAELL